jgi:hypothetical protein
LRLSGGLEVSEQTIKRHLCRFFVFQRSILNGIYSERSILSALISTSCNQRPAINVLNREPLCPLRRYVGEKRFE